MTKLAQESCALKEDINPRKFAMIILGSLPSSYDMFVTSLNARDADNLDWESIKGALVEEFMKRKEKKSINTNVYNDFLFTNGGYVGSSRYHQRPRQNNYTPGNGRQNSNNMLNYNYQRDFGKNSNCGRQQQQLQKRCFKCGDPNHECNNRKETRYNFRARENINLANQMDHLSLNNPRNFKCQISSRRRKIYELC